MVSGLSVSVEAFLLLLNLFSYPKRGRDVWHFLFYFYINSVVLVMKKLEAKNLGALCSLHVVVIVVVVVVLYFFLMI